MSRRFPVPPQREQVMSELKPISIDAVGAALAKAERYRLLNEPREAESICRDVLEADPDNQEATATLVLALTDQFGKGFGNDVTGAQRLLQDFRSEYDRAYYGGIILERWGKAQLARGAPGSIAADWIRGALRSYESAEAIRPEGNDDAILRWNTCIRMLRRELKPRWEPNAPVSDIPQDGGGDEVPRV